jgi:hypothetical protein
MRVVGWPRTAHAAGGLLSSLFKTSAELRLANFALRHQLGGLSRSVPKQLKLTPPNRMLWVWLSGGSFFRPAACLSMWKANRKLMSGSSGECLPYITPARTVAAIVDPFPISGPTGNLLVPLPFIRCQSAVITAGPVSYLSKENSSSRLWEAARSSH